MTDHQLHTKLSLPDVEGFHLFGEPMGQQLHFIHLLKNITQQFG